MIFNIARQIIRVSYPQEIASDHALLNEVAKTFGVEESVPPDFQIFIRDNDDLNDTLKKIPNGPVRSNFNPAKGTAVFSSNHFISRISWSEKVMTVSIDNRFSHPDLLVLENVKLLISLLCIQKGGLPCHSSAVSKSDRAIAFLGNSGSGKSTIAEKLAKTWDLIDDDFNIFLPEFGTFYIHCTPFNVLARNQVNHRKFEPSRLEKIFILKKGITTKTSPLDLRNKFLKMMGNVFAFVANESFGRTVLDNCQRLCETVPIENLFFAKTDDITQKIDALVASGAVS
jgi:hypothetical protein